MESLRQLAFDQELLQLQLNASITDQAESAPVTESTPVTDNKPSTESAPVTEDKPSTESTTVTEGKMSPFVPGGHGNTSFLPMIPKKIPIRFGGSPSRCGARVSRDYASGPGRRKQASLSPNFRFPSTGEKDDASDQVNLLKDLRDNAVFSGKITHGPDVLVRGKRNGSVSSVSTNGSTASDETRESEDSKASRGSGSSVSSNDSSFGRGRKRLANLRGESIFSSNPGSVEFDADKYAGVVRIDFQRRGRLNLEDAIGANISKHVSHGKGKGGEQMPGRIILQSGTKATKGGIKYTAVYLDGTREILDSGTLQYYSSLFSNASTRPENPIKPLVVEML